MNSKKKRINRLETGSRMREVFLVKNTIKDLDDQMKSVNLLLIPTEREFYLKS